MTEKKSRGLIGSTFKGRLSRRIVKDENISQTVAESIVDGVVAFLVMCADYPDKRFVPSPMIDTGWHAFLLFTKEYQKFCDGIAGHFLHHEPKDGSKISTIATYHDTVVFMKKNNIPFDQKLWEACDIHPDIKSKKEQQKNNQEEEFSCCAPSCGGPCCCGA